MVTQKSNKFIYAFTLVEILIVLAILGVITIFSVINGPTQLQKARDAARKTHLDRIKNAIEEYYQDKNCYPQAISSCNNNFVNGNLVLLDRIPCDPSGGLSYTYVPETSDCPSKYQLYANLEYINDGIIDKIGCRNGCGPDCQFNYGIASSNEKLNPYCEIAASEEEVLQYVCAPGGSCDPYADPTISGCPDVYVNDPTCQDKCSDPKNRCHDASGKMN